MGEVRAEATEREPEPREQKCPGPGDAFVTTCSGPESSHPDDKASAETVNIGDSDFAEEVSEDFQKRDLTPEAGISTGSAFSLKETLHRYYDPLPSQGKCAIGAVCGFTSSRLSLGIANRAFRLAGATWVLSEVMETSGFCDEARCVPEEARPWVEHLRNAFVKQCIRVRAIARKMWDRDRIREIAQKDGGAAGGFAAGAFIGFIV